MKDRIRNEKQYHQVMVLNKLNTIKAENARDKEPIQANRIYVVPPDHHLLIEEGRLRVTRGPRMLRFLLCRTEISNRSMRASGKYMQAIGLWPLRRDDILVSHWVCISHGRRSTTSGFILTIFMI